MSPRDIIMTSPLALFLMLFTIFLFGFLLSFAIGGGKDMTTRPPPDLWLVQERLEVGKGPITRWLEDKIIDIVWGDSYAMFVPT